MRISLGSAQFGLHYGIANRCGQVSFDEVLNILDVAWNAGIDTIDTAIAYGNSEAVLGECDVTRWKVTSKIPKLPKDVSDVDTWLKQQVQYSLHRLRIERLDALILHKPSDILGNHRSEYVRGLEQLREQGLVRSIGYSIYSPDELPGLCNTLMPDLVQAPYNLFDRRFETSGWMKRLAGEGVRIHTRSVFLQGLLLLSAGARPAFFDRWLSQFQMLSLACAELQVTPVELALGFALSQPAIERVIVGVDNVTQLRDVLAGVRESYAYDFPQIESRDCNLIEPYRWSVS